MISSGFGVSNGVCQGGIIYSSILYKSIYMRTMDEL